MTPARLGCSRPPVSSSSPSPPGSAIEVPDPQNDEIAAWAYLTLQPHQRSLIDGWCHDIFRKDP